MEINAEDSSERPAMIELKEEIEDLRAAAGGR
jgi:hypothetical protein